MLVFLHCHISDWPKAYNFDSFSHYHYQNTLSYNGISISIISLDIFILILEKNTTTSTNIFHVHTILTPSVDSDFPIHTREVHMLKIPYL